MEQGNTDGMNVLNLSLTSSTSVKQNKMEETNRIVINFTVENWMIYLAVIAIAFSLANSTLNIIKWYYQRKINQLNERKD
jgi:hypothetical protein